MEVDDKCTKCKVDEWIVKDKRVVCWNCGEPYPDRTEELEEENEYLRGFVKKNAPDFEDHLEVILKYKFVEDRFLKLEKENSELQKRDAQNIFEIEKLDDKYKEVLDEWTDACRDNTELKNIINEAVREINIIYIKFVEAINNIEDDISVTANKEMTLLCVRLWDLYKILRGKE